MHHVMRNAQLNHAELHPPRFADHVLVPRRVPNELDISFVDAIDTQNLTLRIVGDCRSHSAARGRERHFHFHFGAAFRFFDQPAIVNEAKIDNVHRDLRVVALTKLGPHVFF